MKKISLLSIISTLIFTSCTSLNPPKILVTGRYKHFISAFGEHVISEEVEQSISEICHEKNINVCEFTVAPCINPKKGLPHHEWWIEFGSSNFDCDMISETKAYGRSEESVRYEMMQKFSNR